MRRLIAFLSSFLLVGALFVTPADATAKGMRLKLRFGWCESACEIRITVTNKSRYNISWVGGTCRLEVNGRYVGKGTIYIGPIKRGRSRTGKCYIVDKRLSRAWYDYQDNGGTFRTRARANAKAYYYYYR
ncbi:hypothetical protein [Sphaerimonospora thailandensis]|uniref:Uncharacterized protein n=1 Tax=Sphaerimonospora thailandensis TaxID=795644 RepID=A0A8J3VX04_9ACTN|nr:hypothetical protein [Sphaerimonospora thailandensis]GIH67907.1 hypothetical protein Mth01_01600 [Sphaerimonospora thailandensis]